MRSRKRDVRGRRGQIVLTSDGRRVQNWKKKVFFSFFFFFFFGKPDAQNGGLYIHIQAHQPGCKRKMLKIAEVHFRQM